jgi:succinyl-diaminopimelate desuccinylase
VNPVGLTASLIRAESCDPPGDETRIVAVLEPLLRDAGFEVSVDRFAERRANIVARRRGAGDRPSLVFSAHMDALPLGEGGWRHPPLGGEIHGGRIYGRGASDMKSGIAAMVGAAISLGETPTRGDLILAFTGGENSDCLGARRLVETNALEGAGAILVSEPSSLAVISAEKAALFLHAEREISDIDDRLPTDSHPLLGRATAVTRANIGGGVDLDLRLLPHHDPDDIEARLGVPTTRRSFKPAVETPLDDPFLAICLEEAGGTPSGQPYFSDACVLAPAFGLSMAILGPGDYGTSGAVDESCLLSNIDAAADIYARIARRYL